MMLNRCLWATVLALALLWGIGQIARDRTFLSGLCFYIPSVLVAVSLLGWAVAHYAHRRRRAAILSLSLALLPLATVVFAENRFFTVRPPTAAHGVRLVHWNVAGGLSPRARAALVEKQAQVYVLSEVPNWESVAALCASLGSEYRAQVYGNLAVIAAGEVTARGLPIDTPRMNVQAVTCELQGRPLGLLVVDLPSAIHIHRDPLLRHMNRLIDQHKPDLVVGDFNAPRRSQALCELPDGYRHAFDSAGTGCGYTWPVPVPMYALDHCLHSPQIVPVRYDLFASICSDHRMQVFDFRWE
jgi:endonuclease/exonuclease/phosphatase (EEP) superfamily protein YafD